MKFMYDDFINKYISIRKKSTLNKIIFFSTITTIVLIILFLFLFEFLIGISKQGINMIIYIFILLLVTVLIMYLSITIFGAYFFRKQSNGKRRLKLSEIRNYENKERIEDIKKLLRKMHLYKVKQIETLVSSLHANLMQHQSTDMFSLLFSTIIGIVTFVISLLVSQEPTSKMAAVGAFIIIIFVASIYLILKIYYCIKQKISRDMTQEKFRDLRNLLIDLNNIIMNLRDSRQGE